MGTGGLVIMLYAQRRRFAVIDHEIIIDVNNKLNIYYSLGLQSRLFLSLTNLTLQLKYAKT